MAKRSSLRASDADRERVAERLKQAATEGRILAHELEDRLAAALRARTYGDLDEAVADLPGARMAARSRPGTRELMVAHPVAAVAMIVVATMVVFVVAAIVLAGLVALSALWIVIGAIMVSHRGGRMTRGRPGGPRRGTGSGATRGAWW